MDLVQVTTSTPPPQRKHILINNMAFEWEKYGITPRTGGSQSDIKHNIDRLYQNVVGRNADPGGSAYWADKIGTGGNDYNTLLSGLTGSKEFTDRAAAVANAGDAGISEAELDKLPSAWKPATRTYSSPSISLTAPGNSGDLGPTTITGDTDPRSLVTHDLTGTGTGLEGMPSVHEGPIKVWDEQPEGTMGPWPEVGTVTQAPIPLTLDPPITETPPITTDPNDPGYLTSGDLTSWWDALDKPWLNQGTDTGTGSDDQFMKMMMFMAMMRPQGGGWGGSQYGYGGLNPGGVQSAYNPMDNLQGYMDAFKTLPGISSGNISTGSN